MEALGVFTVIHYQKKLLSGNPFDFFFGAKTNHNE